MKVTESFCLPSGLELKNRLIFAPVSTMENSVTGEVTADEINFYKQRTGDVAAIVIASASINAKSKAYGNGLSINHDRSIPSLTKLSNTIKSNGTKAFIQLYHGGAMAEASEVVCVSENSNRLDKQKKNKELTDKEIGDILVEYELAILRAIKAGFDGVEIHAANSYLPNQFLMPSWNLREDKWGGSITNRLLFLKEIIFRGQKVIKKHSNKPFSLGVRLSLNDMLMDEIELEKSFVETLVMLSELDEIGLDYIHVMSGNILEKKSIKGVEVKLLALLKEVLKKTPLIGCGSVLQPSDCSKALELSELVSACRPFIIEPKWAKHILTGQQIVLNNIEIDGQFRQNYHLPRNLFKAIKSSPDWYFYQ